MITATKSPKKKTDETKKTEKTAAEGNHCWPGFKPTPGKMAGERGSCEPVKGKKSPATKRAAQKTAAASKLEKAGKPNHEKN